MGKQSESGRENNFDLIRLFAASQVLIFHTLHHLGIRENHPFFELFSWFPGVQIFFTVSGYLIYSAYDRNPDIKRYAINRLLRIYPALWVCLLITVLCMLGTGAISSEQLFSSTLLKWIVTQISFMQFWTPDILRGWGVGTPNGSLWTIPVELQFYIFLPILLLVFRKIRADYKMFLLFIFSLIMNAVLRSIDKEGHTLAGKLAAVTLLPYLYSFLGGALLYYHRNRIRPLIEGKGMFWMSLFLAYCFFTGNSPSYFPELIQIPANLILTILTISLAFTRPQLGSILRGNDISYGLYIYHMPVINTILSLGFKGNYSVFFLCIGITALMAFFSWSFIERHALKLKNRLLY